MLDFKTQDAVDVDLQKDQYLIFTVASDYYGLEIKNVTEIVGIQKITPVPELPEHIKGIINLRGKIIPVIDVRAWFKKPIVEYTDRTCIIVVEMQNISIGLIVDLVTDVVSMSENDIAPTPEYGRVEQSFIKGIGKIGDDVRLILDCDKLMNAEYASQIKDFMGK